MTKLTGSEKQIKWAEEIRVKFFIGLAEFEEKLTKWAEPDDVDDLFGGENLSLINRRKLETLKKITPALQAIASAKTWIDIEVTVFGKCLIKDFDSLVTCEGFKTTTPETVITTLLYG